MFLIAPRTRDWQAGTVRERFSREPEPHEDDTRIENGLRDSAIADSFSGSVVHLANHDLMLWAVSRAPPR
jgi:predicted dithiol-disulfide oxidoreductase (DUF899 family)